MVNRQRRRAVAALLCAAAVLTSCTDDSPADTGSTGGSGEPSDAPTAGAIADGVPVAGSHVVFGGDDLDVPVRVAVHALRRVPGATVLDWSLTAIPTSERPAGETLSLSPGSLGLEMNYGYHAIDLVDPAAGQVYRPLISGKEDNADCACRPLFTATYGLKVGETAMVQLAFPELPADTTTMDVNLLGIPTIEDVPVAPEGKVPVSKGRVDLAAPAEQPKELARTQPFDYPQGSPEGKLVIGVEQVIGGPERTTLVWRLTAEEPVPGLDPHVPPVTDDALAPNALAPLLVSYKTTIASGPGLVPTGADPSTNPVLRASFATLQANTYRPPEAGDDHSWLQCRCTDVQLKEPALGTAGASLQLVTETGPLPAGTTSVSVAFPGSKVPPLQDIPVTAPKSAPKVTFADAEVGTYDVDLDNYPEPLTLADWPTPVPSAAALAQAPEVVIDTLRLNATEPNLKATGSKDKVEVTLDTAVFFGPDSAKLRPAAQRAIDRIAARVRDEARPGTEVTIVGHVAGTSAGSVTVQQRLSEQRAEAVRKALQSRLSDVDLTLVASGRGAKDPVASNDTEEGREQNRRVVVTFAR